METKYVLREVRTKSVHITAIISACAVLVQPLSRLDVLTEA